MRKQIGGSNVESTSGDFSMEQIALRIKGSGTGRMIERPPGNPEEALALTCSACQATRNYMQNGQKWKCQVQRLSVLTMQIGLSVPHWLQKSNELKSNLTSLRRFFYIFSSLFCTICVFYRKFNFIFYAFFILLFIYLFWVRLSLCCFGLWSLSWNSLSYTIISHM